MKLSYTELPIHTKAAVKAISDLDDVNREKWSKMIDILTENLGFFAQNGHTENAIFLLAPTQQKQSAEKMELNEWIKRLKNCGYWSKEIADELMPYLLAGDNDDTTT